MDLDRLLPARFRAHGATWWATRAHWLSLVVAFAFLTWVNRHQWFNVDEWNFLVDRGLAPKGDDLGLLAPHNEHWSTIPVLGYRVLFSIFGTRTYLPYITVLLLIHLLVAHLLWRVLRRVGVEIWFATIAIALFAVLGVGWENLTSAFQWQLIAPLATGIGALLLTPTKGPLGWRDALVVALLTLGLTFSGIGLTMVVVVAMVVLLRRGPLIALANIIVPGVVYLAWYAGYGRDAAPGPLQKDFTAAVQDIPAYVWRGLTGAVDGATGLDGIGVVVISLLVLWLMLRRASPSDEPWPVVLATGAGAVVFLTLTTIRRSGLGIETAASSRYAYVVVALLLPAVALALDGGLRRSGLRWVVLILGGAALLLVQASVLTRNANEWATSEQEQKRRIVATAQLLRDGADVIYAVPVPTFIPNLSFDEIARLDRADQLPGNVRVSRRDLLTARAYLQSSLGPTAVVSSTEPPSVLDASGIIGKDVDASGCSTFSNVAPGTIVLELRGDAALPMRTSLGGTLELAFRSGGATGRSRSYLLQGASRQILSLSAREVEALLTLPPGSTEICGLAPG